MKLEVEGVVVIDYPSDGGGGDGDDGGLYYCSLDFA